MMKQVDDLRRKVLSTLRHTNRLFSAYYELRKDSEVGGMSSEHKSPQADQNDEICILVVTNKLRHNSFVAG